VFPKVGRLLMLPDWTRYRRALPMSCSWMPSSPRMWKKKQAHRRIGRSC